MCCWQVWKVDSLGEKNDCQSIVLNYGGLIHQRLVLFCISFNNIYKEYVSYIMNDMGFFLEIFLDIQAHIKAWTCFMCNNFKQFE